MAKTFFRVIVPDKELFDLDEFLRSSVKVLNSTRDEVKKDFESVTGTWNKKPAFRGKKATANKLVAQMWGNKDTWVWGNRGTRPHIIRPRRSVLRFRPGYNRKSSLASLASFRGGSFGRPVYTRRPIRHPGSDGGFWDKLSAIKQRPKLVQEMKKVTKKAAS